MKVKVVVLYENSNVFVVHPEDPPELVVQEPAERPEAVEAQEIVEATDSAMPKMIYVGTMTTWDGAISSEEFSSDISRAIVWAYR